MRLFPFLIIIAVVLIVFFYFTSTYNKLVSKREEVRAQFAQIDNVLKRRYDLIPNLVNTVKGIMHQEQEIFLKIADARTKYGLSNTNEDKIKNATEMESLISRLLVIVENYPQLRSSESFNKLMDELSGTENRIAVERRRYNEKVREYNTTIKKFPTNILAQLFGFKEEPYFEIPSFEKKAPSVNFEEGGVK